MLADEIGKIRNLVDIQMCGTGPLEFRLTGTAVVQLARQLLDLEYRVRELERHTVPAHLTNPLPAEDRKIIRLDHWKAKQPEKRKN